MVIGDILTTVVIGVVPAGLLAAGVFMHMGLGLTRLAYGYVVTAFLVSLLFAWISFGRTGANVGMMVEAAIAGGFVYATRRRFDRARESGECPPGCSGNWPDCPKA